MAVVATGFFDGVHLGHRQVIQTLVSSARERGEEAIVVTFAQHPRAVLQQDARTLRLLNSPQEKEALLRDLGVDNYGIYGVVGEAVALFSILTTSLSSAISRYLTYELGRGDRERLRLVFSTSVSVLLLFSVGIILLAEPLCLWFIQRKMEIPPDRLQVRRDFRAHPLPSSANPLTLIAMKYMLHLVI
jgi:hypothetical protein